MILRPIRKGTWAFYAICEHDHCPLLAWLNTMPKDQKASANRLLAIIDNAAYDRRGPLLLAKEISHQVDDNHAIYEFIAGKLRLLWFYSPTENKVVICSVGFRKKTQKTSRKHIDAAVRIKDAYIQAVDNDDIVILED